jgi:hypothetical protein
LAGVPTHPVRPTVYHLRFFALMLAIVVLSGPGVFSQEKKDKDTKDTAKGMLPTYWKQLGLSKDQTQEVYTIQAKYKAEIAKLRAELDELEGKQKKELEKVLTDAQKTKLREIIASKAGLSPDEKKDKSDKSDKSKSDK